MTDQADQRPAGIYRLSWVFYLFLALGGALWIGWGGQRIPVELFVDPQRWWWDLGLGIACGGGLLLLWEGLRRTLDRARELEARIAEVLGPIDTSGAISLALISGFSEEIFFRGAVQGAWGFTAALVVFTLLHTGPGPAFRLWTAFAALAGALFGGLMLWRGNLLAPVVAHVVVNAVNLRRLGSLRLAAEHEAERGENGAGGADEEPAEER